MTNYERWRTFTRKLTSPDSWIDYGFYFLVSAALQRRVWLYGGGEDGGELFPNLYLCFVGPPGIGKGIVLGPIARLLKHHKYEKGQLIKTNTGTEKPPIFPVGADSITFEELLSDVAEAIRRVPKPDGTVYVHSSYTFVLEELDSLFKRKTQDVVNFLKNAYDCKSYDYKTKHQGKNLLRNLCMSFIAGTQADFLVEARKVGLFGQGFASRTLFLFEKEERFSSFHNTEVEPEQKVAEAEILSWIKRLATIYGEVRYDENTYRFLEAWNRDCLTPARIKAHPKMADYFSRKKVTMLKLAMAIHFSESLDMVIPCETFNKAIKILDANEPKLEIGFGGAGRNAELHNYVRRIKEFILTRGTVAEKEVIIAFSMDMTVQEIKTSLEELELIGAVKTRQEKNHKIYYV